VALSWRLLHTPPLDGVENMAIDEALLTTARRAGWCVLRVYTWSRPTLSVGRHQAARDVYDPLIARDLGIDVVRRLTGGRAVLHHREVTYSVAAPLVSTDPVRTWYASVNGILTRALRALGVPAALAARNGRAAVPGSAPCFEHPAEGEVVVDGRKLVGSALVREGGALLQHGSILLEDDQPTVPRLARRAVAPVAPAATLRGTLGRDVSADEVRDALFDAVREVADARADGFSLAALARDDLVRARARYASDGWTWRR
jgi:lipoate-protein ligase A